MVPNGAKNVTVYDPAAGSGTLVLALAHEIGESNCTIYTQDISQKSNEFLRLNLILNNLVHSLPNVVHDDTLLRPYHKNAKGDGLATFDYIVSNPPFNMDFSDSRDTLAGDNYKKRFWAGVPNIPNKDKDKMAIYLMFLQHIIYSLGPKGKAAVVVPTGFLTAGSGIQKKIREHLVKERMLRGVISMPSNIFASTGTNVSILFLNRENKDGNVILMDASKLGTKEKVDGKNQRTVLSVDEITHIIKTFNAGKAEDDFCVTVSYADIEGKKLSFSAGQYFEVKIEYVELTPEEFAEKIKKNPNGNYMRLVHNKPWNQYTWNEVPRSHQVKDRADDIKEEGLWQEVRDKYLEKKNMYLSWQDHNHPSFVVYVEAVNEVYNRYFNRGGGYSVQSIF